MNRYLQIAPVVIAGLLWLSRIFLRDGGVGLVNGLVVFLISWWLILFMTLPVGVRSQQENGDIQEGSEPGAPVTPMLAKKAWWTTVITSIVWIIYFAIAESGVINEFLPRDGSWG
ncbi:DUF1467 family protein [Maricaulis sp.]|uniref:DUF1467 family protein n=1 Tax=unclassified Maricaulis TaxID=2632371 RepID=UPI001B2CCE76|nr:DUF1467 family protein [Maricaulis sp.]MBO6798192.1 DUF1467 family protein [Maricaulis sp.]